MPDTELLKHPLMEDGSSLQDQVMLTNTSSSCVEKALRHIKELRKKLENSHQQHIFCKGKKQHDNTMGIDGVLQEAMTLIQRLELDRQKATEALQKEQIKRQMLIKKQDDLCLWKQQHFPAAVQNEYESSIRDITELKWNLKVKKDQLQKVRNSLNHTEAQNRQLVKELDFLKKHSPLIKEKLQLEIQMTKQIKSAKDEATDTFTQLSHELSSAQQELDTEELLASKEKEDMTMELRDARKQLKDQLSDIQKLKSHGDNCCTKIHETKEKISLKEKQLGATRLQISFLETQEAKINETIVELREKKEANKKKELENEGIQKQIQTTRSENKTKLFEYEEVFSRKQLEHLHLQDQNKEHELEIEDYNKKIHQSKQMMKQLQEACKQILEKISQNEEKRKQASGELSLWATQHANTKARLEDLEQQTFRQEQRNREETERLKMQLKGEVNEVAVLKGNISSILEEYNLLKAACEREENELLTEYKAASSATAQLESEVAKLKEIHTEKHLTLERKLNDALTKRKNLYDDLEEQKTACLECLDSETKALSGVSVRSEQTSCRTEELRLKSEAYRKESDIMEQIIVTMPQDIEELQNMFDMVEYKYKTVSVTMNSLQCDVEACRSRNRHSEETFSNLLAQRQAVMLEIKANLKKALTENGELAKEYSALQKALLIARREAACALHKKNETEASLHDFKQLSLLQRRMHEDMLENFEHRSVYSQAELARCQALSNENNQKMKALQEKCSGAIDRISAFLHTLTDNSTTRHDAAIAGAAADELEPVDNDGLNRAIPTAE